MHTFRIFHLLIFSFLTNFATRAQDVSALMQKPLTGTVAERAATWKHSDIDFAVAFASSGIRIQREMPPSNLIGGTCRLYAWRNESVSVQIVSYGRKAVNKVAFHIDDLKNEHGDIIKAEHLKVAAIDYVITDEFAGGCGYRKAKDFDSSYVADIINERKESFAHTAATTQPAWLSIKVPASAMPGTYKGTIKVLADRQYELHINAEVADRLLPDPSSWKFALDLWQHPAAIARVHGLKMWSEEHYAFMRKYYSMLARAGQKTITASVVEEPWNHQTYDDYPSLIQWRRTPSGSWTFDYSKFDKYVAFVMSCGIKGAINCYSMVPWKIAFKYYDEATGSYKEFTDPIGSTEYNKFWRYMLTDFTAHLKQKGWFSITRIAMDERPMEAMKSVIALLKSIDPAWKIALAGDYHEEIVDDIYDYCVASKWTFPDAVLKSRKQQGKLSTWYTCCTEKYPNLFTFSGPAEGTWIGWYTAATDMDGYVRWAFNSWPKAPLVDSRFTAWPAGDTFMMYPGPLSSVRFEKLIEGVQDFEKIGILLDEYKKAGKGDQLHALKEALAHFRIANLSKENADVMVNKYKHLLNH